MRAVMVIAMLSAALLAGPASARTLLAGGGAEGGLPDLAAAVQQARDGDTIRLAAGTYYECAIITQNDLVLEGAGADTVLTDRTCEAKAILVVRGRNLTVRDLTLARARVPDGNGAGIRLEGPGLTLERVRFDNDQVGVLAVQAGPGRIRITECRFDGGGVAGERPTAALTVGAMVALRVERSTFTHVKGGQISTATDRSEILDSRIETGVEPGAGPAVLVSAGVLSMRGNVLALGPNPPDHDAAVLAMGDGAELRGNRMENTTGRPQRLLLDWMQAAPVLEGNTLAPGDTLVSSAGLWRHRAGGLAHAAVDRARGAAGAAKAVVKGVLGR